MKSKKINLLFNDPLAVAGIIILTIFIIIAIFAPQIAPYDPNEIIRVDGKIQRLQRPSGEFIFGTTYMGRDIFSQVVMGSRIALRVGLLAAFFVAIIGTTVGLVSGYYGGWIDTIAMRFVDILYGIPFIPFVIILVSLLKPSVWNIILAVSILTWRTVARIVRSQVLSIIQRPYIKAARVAGASDFRIMFFHILPNILPLIFVEMSFIVGWAIISEASVSFVGFGDPRAVSWGKILHTAFNNGAVRVAPWWVAPPGFAIVLLVISVFLISRGIEQAINPRLRDGR